VSDVLPLVRGELSPRTPGGRSVIWAATGRLGGHSGGPYASANLADHVGDDPAHVAANRDSVQALVAARGLAVVRAEHGAQVVHVTAVQPDVTDACDGLTTVDPDLALLALGADCSTFVLTDGHVLAVGHCGWAGLVVDLPGALFSAAHAFHPSAAWQVIVGPTICAECYPVSRERWLYFREHAPAHIADAALRGEGIDIRAGVHAAFRAAAERANGEDGSHVVEIADVSMCTYESPDLYSYRRDGVTGRQGLVAKFATSGTYDQEPE